MDRRTERQSPSLEPSSEIQPDDFETLVQMHQRYPEEVVVRASRRAITEGRRRSQRSDLSPYPSLSQSPSRLDVGGPSRTTSPQLFFSETARMSAASTSSSYSQVSTAANSSLSGATYLALPGLGSLRNKASDSTMEPRDEHTDHSDTEDQRRARRGEAAKNYVCTYCNKDFGGKSDWKRHETTFHEPQYTWECPVCNRTFNSRRKFSTHHDRDHDCMDCDHSTEAQKSLPAKAAFGCGFQSCNQVLYSWDDRCNHVAKHFEDGEIKQNWHYSTMIKNLLRQDRLESAWKRLLGEMHGPREFWPNLVWRQEDTKELRERLEYGTYGNVSELLHTAHGTGLTNASARPEMPTLPSPALRSTTDPVIVNPFSDNEALLHQSQLDAMRAGAASISPGHPGLGADMYPSGIADMQYYQTQTVTPPGDTVTAPSLHSLPQPGQGQVYHQMQYAGQVDYHTTYTLEHPSPYPPVSSNSILASDQFYASRPVAQAQRSSLPPQPHGGPPIPPTPPHHERGRSRSSRQPLGKRLYGGSSRKRSESRSDHPGRSERVSPSPESLDEVHLLPSSFHPDSFL